MLDLPKVLATDLDGTLIPLAGNEQNEHDLRQLKLELAAADMRLTYATGRHLASVKQAIEQYQLPVPDWIICDVGTSLYRCLPSGVFQPSQRYADHLRQIVGDCCVTELAKRLAPIASLRLQEAEKQGRFKLSFYCDAEQLSASVGEIEQTAGQQQLPYSVIASLDPFEQVGLIDLLPKHVSKAYALQWWSQSQSLALRDIIFAGDSGNDSAALEAGYRAIVVGNASPEVLSTALLAHAAAGLSGRIYSAKEPATSGVLAGLRHFRNLATDGSSVY